jgi:hypothetical protein
MRKPSTLGEREAIVGGGMTRACARATVGRRGEAGDVMAAKRTASSSTGKRRAPRTEAETPTPDAARQPARERRFVDIDPWALLERLMEVPEEGEPAEHKNGG